ncbi:MAG: aspartate carbamoyltransferase catalytic subunit [Erysipelotrichaceae bacterium]
MSESIPLKHLLSVEDLQISEVERLLERAEAFKQGEVLTLNREIYAANLFFENSTRTHRSFEMAEKKLGMGVIQFEPSTSSVNKGETLYDTCLTMAAIGVEVLVIRHPQDEYYKGLLNLPISLINGGDGRGQHPTQCLLDLMTIREEFGHFKGLNVAILGDLRNSRVARSNATMLKRLGANLFFGGPEEWHDERFNEYGIRVTVDEAVKIADVVMLLRVQHERHDGQVSFSKEEYHARFGLTVPRWNTMKAGAILMHPAPVNRDVELADALVEAPNARIVRQMENGVFARMAVLEAILKGRGAV